MEIASYRQTQNTVTTGNLELDLSWILFVIQKKTQMRGPQEPKKLGFTHSLLQPVMLVQSGQVTKI